MSNNRKTRHFSCRFFLLGTSSHASAIWLPVFWFAIWLPVTPLQTQHIPLISHNLYMIVFQPRSVFSYWCRIGWVTTRPWSTTASPYRTRPTNIDCRFLGPTATFLMTSPTTTTCISRRTIARILTTAPSTSAVAGGSTTAPIRYPTGCTTMVASTLPTREATTTGSTTKTGRAMTTPSSTWPCYYTIKLEAVKLGREGGGERDGVWRWGWLSKVIHVIHNIFRLFQEDDCYCLL